MTSLQQLLSDEHSENFIKSQKKVGFRDKDNNHLLPTQDHDSLLPIYICHDRRRSFDKKKKNSSDYSRRSNSISSSSGSPAIDEVAIRAVISILSGYVARFLKDENFRVSLRKKCHSCLKTGENRGISDSGTLANFELGVESIQRIVENPGEEMRVSRMKLLRNSIRLLSIVASVNTKSWRRDSTLELSSANLSACAQLYLSIVYKIEQNDRISSRHLLQVFCDSPFVARAHLLPDLWEHFFLPHLLHLKIWYGNEIEFLENLEYKDKEKKMKALSKVYNEKMDMGTVKFAHYYKNWLRVGSQSPSVPTIPLPSTPGYKSSRRMSVDSLTPRASINKALYRTIFGPIKLDSRSVDLGDKNRSPVITCDLAKEEEVHIHESNPLGNGYAQPLHHMDMAYRRSSNQTYRTAKTEILPEAQKLDIFRFLSCQSEPAHVGTRGSMRMIEKTQHPQSDFNKAVTVLCSSDSLNDCELAIRVVVRTWLDMNGDLMTEKALSKAPIIEGMLEVLYTSNDDEILELTISILAELVTRNEANGHAILNLDLQLEIFMKLLRSSSLFLKAAILLYLVKPKAKQMISIEWVPLVLRVLEFSDQLQILLAVRCSPQVAAYYILDQLLTGYDEGKNLENARQVVYMGGLGLLIRRIEKGDLSEKAKAASVIFCCILADGDSRHYIAANLDKGSIVELLVYGIKRNVQWCGIELLTELLCLNRRTEANKFLHELLVGWDSFNTMHVLFSHLQKAKLEERPIIAVILLQLDLLGDPQKCSVYREEVVDVILSALDCDKCNKKVQEEAARALSIFGGRFSYKGVAMTEKWILKEAGFNEKLGDSFHGNDIVIADLMHLNVEEDNAMETWQRNTATALLTCGKKRLLVAICNSIANGIPCLARASLVTVAWISCYLHTLADKNLRSMMCSVLVPLLVQLLDLDRAIEERVLASFTLLNLAKCRDLRSEISAMDERLISHLRNLSRVTWTAHELILIITKSSTKISVSRAA